MLQKSTWTRGSDPSRPVRCDLLKPKLYIYPYRIAQRKPHPILWSFDRESLNEIAERFENKSVFSVEVNEKTITLRLIE